MSSIIIEPKSIEEGIPITVSVPKNFPLKTSYVQVSGKSSMQVPLLPFNSEYLQAQFAIYRSGQYTLSIGEYKKTIQVAPISTVSFFPEFGVWAVTVTLFLGGLILWIKKRKKNLRAGSI